MNNLFTELRRRSVFRVAGLYLVVGWLLIQVAVAVLPTFGAPAWVAKVFIALIASGFPIALILAWAFEMTPEGMKRTTPLSEDNAAPKANRALDYVVLAGFAVIAVMIVWQTTRPAPHIAKASASVSAQAAANKTADEASIAVLPFADLSPKGDQKYFAEGIAEEILNVLANVSGLEVASRTSSFQFEGQENVGVPVIAKQLHVRHILEGSVRKSGDTIRITAQLIDADTDKHMWSQTYDRTLTTSNIFAVQDEITKAIVDQLSSRMGGKAKITAPAARTADTQNTDAYALFLEGQSLFILRGANNLRKSMAALERAVELDPNFARAWAVLSADYSVALGWFSGAYLDRDYAELALDAAKKAIALDPSLSLPYAVLATQTKEKQKYDEAFALYDKAIERDPRDESIYMWRAVLWSDLGFFDKAIADLDKCLSLNPDYDNCRDYKSEVQIMAGDVAGGLATFYDTKRRGFAVSGTNPAQIGAANQEHNEIMLLDQLNYAASNLAPGDTRWAVDMFYQALTNPAYDRKEALRVVEARLEGMKSPLVPHSYNATLVYFLLGAYDRMHPVADGWWWATTGYPKWAVSPERKRLMKELKLDVYWRKHGFPPRCHPVGPQTADSGDFDCK